MLLFAGYCAVANGSILDNLLLEQKQTGKGERTTIELKAGHVRDVKHATTDRTTKRKFAVQKSPVTAVNSG